MESISVAEWTCLADAELRPRWSVLIFKSGDEPDCPVVPTRTYNVWVTECGISEARRKKPDDIGILWNCNVLGRNTCRACSSISFIDLHDRLLKKKKKKEPKKNYAEVELSGHLESIALRLNAILSFAVENKCGAFFVYSYCFFVDGYPAKIRQRCWNVVWANTTILTNNPCNPNSSFHRDWNHDQIQPHYHLTH